MILKKYNKQFSLKLIVATLFSMLLSHYQSFAVGDSTCVETKSSLELKLDSIIDFADKHVGIRYVYGGKSKAGFDCSGFTHYVFKNFGYKLPTSSSAYYNTGVRVSLSEAQKGDILVFKGSNIKSSRPGHVGIVVSNDENGLVFIHSASGNRRGIVYTKLQTCKYYKPRLLSVRRVIE
jgi:cell wall-associated NlpC family hydrolase